MIPSPIPEVLQGMSQVEEMLIARVMPFMNIYCKPRGRQRAYKGHVITFPFDVQTVANLLPNLPDDLPLLKFVPHNDNENSQSKDFRVRKAKILNALEWLIENNPVYSDVTISYERIEILPEDENISINKCIEIEKSHPRDEVPVDLGPIQYEDNEDKEFSSFIPTSSNSKLQTDLIAEHFVEPFPIEAWYSIPCNNGISNFIS